MTEEARWSGEEDILAAIEITDGRAFWQINHWTLIDDLLQLLYAQHR